MTTESVRHRFYLIVAGLLLILAAQCLYFAHDNGQTVDETFYNGSGYPIVRYNNYGILGEHPPLAMQLGSLPLLFLQPHYPIDDPIHIGNTREFDISKMGSAFLYKMGNDPSLILFLERIPIIVLTLILGFVLFQWASQLYGAGGGILSLVLFSFCPNMIAHGSLFTTDMAVTVFIFTSCYALKHFFDRPTLKNIILVGIFCGLAFLSKMTALFLIPTMCLLFTLFFFSEFRKQNVSFSSKFNYSLIWLSIAMFLLSLGQKMYFVGLGPLCLIAAKICLDEERNRIHPRIFSILHALLWSGWVLFLFFLPQMAQKRGLVVTACATVWSITLFLTFFYLNRLTKQKQLMQLMKMFALVWIIASVVVLLGYTDFPKTLFLGKGFGHFIRTFNIASNHTLSQHKLCIKGSFVTCDWRYFPALMGIKTPVVTLVLFFTGLFWFLKSKFSKLDKAIVLIPPALFLLAACFISQINIGLRHVLPIYPFIFLTAGAVWPFISSIKNNGSKRMAKSVLFAGLIYFAVTQIKVAPHHLSYFNEFIGSAEQGGRYVTDSNINWGQDNKRLALFLRKQGITSIAGALHFYNAEEYGYYQILYRTMTEDESIHPSAGIYALDLLAYWAEQEKPESWFKNRMPTYKIGKTIYLYQV